jgi:hypothetical protein
MSNKLTKQQPVNATLLAGSGKPTVQNDPMTADAIATQFAAFEQRICERAARHSLSWVPGYRMSPVDFPDAVKENIGLAILSAAASSMESVSVEKRDGEWAIWYAHTSSLLQALAVANAPRKPAMRMRDASLLTRQRFMQEHSLKFAERFVAMCNEISEKRAAAINAGDEALRFLDNG